MQAFIIIGGVLRVVPLTGITLPFVSFGGSSLLANYIIVGILLRISDHSARDRATAPSTAGTAPDGTAPYGGRRPDGPAALR